MIGRVRGAFDRASGYAPADFDNIKSFFVELHGELQPQTVRGVSSEAEKEPATAPIHEYFWNVGITGNEMTWYNDLADDDALVVQLIFHTSRSRYIAHEIAANLTQVPPYQKTTTEAIMDWIDLYKPLAETAGKALEAAGAGAPGKALSAVAGMKMNAVPVTKFRWYVKTFTIGEEAGIEWHIPRDMLTYTGNRICGSLGVTLLDCGTAPATSGLSASLLEEKSLSLEIKAFLRFNSGSRILGSHVITEVFLNTTQDAFILPLTPL